MRSARPGRRLLVVAAVIALTLAGAGAALAWEGYRDARAAELEEVADGARAGAADVSQFLAGREQVLEALATNEGIVRGDGPAVDRRLEMLDLRRLQFTAGLAWIDPFNRVHAFTGEPGPEADPEQRLRAAILRAQSSKGPFVSEALPPSVFAAPAIAIAVPTRDARGLVNGALVAGVDLEWLNAVAADLARVRGGRVAIVDRAGQLIVAPGFAGVTRAGADPLVRRAEAEATGTAVKSGAVTDARGLDGRTGQMVGFAYEPARTGWTLFVARDAADALGDAATALRLQLGGLGLLVLVGIGGAALVGRRLDRLAGERDALLEAARQAEGRAAFLAHAAAALDEEPRLEGRLERLAGLCVPRLGERCAVELAARDGGPPRAAIAAGNEAPAVAGSPDLEAPLRVGGRAVGSIATWRGDGAGESAEGDQELLTRLADQASLQLESARLYELEHEIAGTLQRSLLPDALPAVAGVVLAARYLPAGTAVEAGGDWYEAVPLGDGRVGLAVGDVVGKGARAAAAMGQLRSALRAFAMEGFAPAALLTRLSRFAETVPEAACATLAYAVVDAGNGEVRYACAGHPYPLIVEASGAARLLHGGRGAPLGLWEPVRFTEGTARLEEGDAIALYTDGLIERRREGLDAGFARLEAAAAGLAGLRVADLCDGLLSALVSDVAGDDIALLVARRVGLRATGDEIDEASRVAAG